MIKGNNAPALLYGSSVNGWFTPSKHQIQKVNEFAKVTGSYFAQPISRLLLKMEENPQRRVESYGDAIEEYNRAIRETMGFSASELFMDIYNNPERRWDLSKLNGLEWLIVDPSKSNALGLGDQLCPLVEVFPPQQQSFYTSGIPRERSTQYTTYQVPGLGDQLYQLERIATNWRDVYKGHILSKEWVINIKRLELIHQKLQTSITEHLTLHRTALLLMDYPYKKKFNLLCFSGLKLQPHAQTILGLRKLPSELQEEILHYVFLNMLEHYPTVRERDAYRVLMFANEIPSLPNESGVQYQNRLLRYHTTRLLPYLANIETKEDCVNFLKIPENKYGMLF